MGLHECSRLVQSAALGRLAPGVNGTITHYSAITNTARVKSFDSSRGAGNYAITYLEPAHDVAARMLASVLDAICGNFGECG